MQVNFLLWVFRNEFGYERTSLSVIITLFLISPLSRAICFFRWIINFSQFLWIVKNIFKALFMRTHHQKKSTNLTKGWLWLYNGCQKLNCHILDCFNYANCKLIFCFEVFKVTLGMNPCFSRSSLSVVITKLFWISILSRVICLFRWILYSSKFL